MTAIFQLPGGLGKPQPDMSTSSSQEEPDVVLMLEGTYPYVLGGVSSWVDQIIKGLPELKFGLFFLGSKKDSSTKQLYKVPSNVVSTTEVYLHDRLSEKELRPGKVSSRLRALIC